MYVIGSRIWSGNTKTPLSIPAIRNQEMAKDLKTMRQALRADGVFYTDEKLARMMRDIIGTTDEVYDPTCGDGNLLAVFPDEVRKYGQELDCSQLEIAAQRLVNFKGVCGDVLEAPGFIDRKFKAITGNPPFSIDWSPENHTDDPVFTVAPALAPRHKADYAFILHILHCLADDGIAVVLNFPGILYRGNAEGKIRRWLVEQNYIESVSAIPGGYFVDTKIATALIVFRKNKNGTDITFEDVATGKTIDATIDEVRAQDFNLSPNNYLPYEDDKPQIDIDGVNSSARCSVVRNLDASLSFEEALASLSGDDITPLLDKLQAVIDRHRNFSCK